MAERRVDTATILEKLETLYPDATTELNHGNPFELLIATILSAQATDKKVNEITRDLFKKYPRPEDYLSLAPEELEQEIKTIGLYRNKARNILATCRILVEKYGGRVPADRDALESLPGVGRKTANVVLANAFDVPAIAVDTHVFRVANRLGLARADNPLETEKQLMRRIPKDKWSQAHHWLIWHGRRICQARSPRCEVCPLAPECRYYRKHEPKPAPERASKHAAKRAAVATRRD